MTAYRSVLLAAALAAAGLSGAAEGTNDKPAREAGAAQKDYAAELPRIPPKDPAEALKAFAVRPGFHVELAAAEPLLRSPVAIDFDEDGRLYVAEFPEYNQSADPKPHGKGCVRLLEDIEGDGVYDKSTVFADDVPMATAVACWDGGVYVGSAPDLLYLKDTDGDGKADLRRVVFTGFGTDPGGEGDAELVPLGPRQPVSHLDQHRRRRNRPRPAGRRRRRCRSAAKTSSSTRAARRSS